MKGKGSELLSVLLPAIFGKSRSDSFSYKGSYLLWTGVSDLTQAQGIYVIWGFPRISMSRSNLSAR